MVSGYFLDSSALVKRYVAETGTAWVQSIPTPHTRNKLIIACITWVDDRLIAIAQAEGLLTDNPNHHP